MWEDVYAELIKCPLFCGVFDAKNGDVAFMNGIATVMEYIAGKADKWDEFNLLFDANYLLSKKKAGMLESKEK